MQIILLCMFMEQDITLFWGAKCFLFFFDFFTANSSELLEA